MSIAKPKYHYISSPEYIDELQFDYIETYSFQRGKTYDDQLKDYVELRDTRQELGKLTESQQKRFDQILRSRPKQIEYLLDSNGQFHHSSQRTHTFRKDSPEVEQIVAILRIEPLDIPAWMCAPFYRDAIVFYDSIDHIVSVLNICLSCYYMQTQPFHFVNADAKGYDELKQFFVGIGHLVENE
jgi:hypothetical protein